MQKLSQFEFLTLAIKIPFLFDFDFARMSSLIVGQVQLLFLLGSD